jgi:sortase A
MQPKISFKWPLLIVGIVGIALFFVFLSYLAPKRSIQINSAPFVQNTADLSQASFGLPVRLKIPKIDVDSAVESVEFTSDGAMDVPKVVGDVGWFSLGQRPGENGTAVIDGHYGILKGGKASVFDNLYLLREGDKIYIQDDKGATVSFVVSESKRYDPKASASNVFSSNDGNSHLNLITCEGTWDEASKSYSKRLVVFTDKE